MNILPSNYCGSVKKGHYPDAECNAAYTCQLFTQTNKHRSVYCYATGKCTSMIKSQCEMCPVMFQWPGALFGIYQIVESKMKAHSPCPSNRRAININCQFLPNSVQGGFCSCFAASCT